MIAKTIQQLVAAAIIFVAGVDVSRACQCLVIDPLEDRVARKYGTAELVFVGKVGAIKYESERRCQDSGHCVTSKIEVTTFRVIRSFKGDFSNNGGFRLGDTEFVPVQTGSRSGSCFDAPISMGKTLLVYASRRAGANRLSTSHCSSKAISFIGHRGEELTQELMLLLELRDKSAKNGYRSRPIRTSRLGVCGQPVPTKFCVWLIVFR